MHESPYHPAVLREQIETLRQAAAERARLERDITADHAAATQQARAEADTAVTAARRKHATETEATRREHAEILEKTRAKAASEQKKLDDERRTKAATIDRTAKQEVQQAREDDEFEANGAREVFQDNRKNPPRLFAKAEKDLARIVGEIDEAAGRATKQLAAWKVPEVSADGADGGAAATADPRNPLAVAEALRVDAVERAKAILGDRKTQRVFSGGLLAAAALLPWLAGGLAALGAWFGIPGDDATSRLTVAGVLGGVVAVIGSGLGVWQVMRGRTQARGRLRDEAARLHAAVARTGEQAPEWRRVLEKRRDEQTKQVERQYEEETVARKARLDAKLAASDAKRDHETTHLETRYAAATESLRQKVAVVVDGADKKYPARLTALDAARWSGARARAGVYAHVLGPSYETRAEYRMLRRFAADCVGMSTVPEAIAARRLGLAVAAVSVVTNVARPDAPGRTDAAEVCREAAAAAEGVWAIIRAIAAATAPAAAIGRPAAIVGGRSPGRP